MKQRGPLMGLEPTTLTLRVRRATHCMLLETDRQTGADGRTGKQAGRQTAIFTQVSNVTICNNMRINMFKQIYTVVNLQLLQ